MEVREWLAAAGHKGVLCASYVFDGIFDAGWPGLDHNNRLIGAAAIDWLARMVEHGETGIPTTPIRMLVPGVWRDL